MCKQRHKVVENDFFGMTKDCLYSYVLCLDFFMLQVRTIISKRRSKLNVLEGGGEWNHNISELFTTSLQNHH